MIAGLFITYFKTYSKINFIKLSDEHNLCGILGKNGVGKSSILEALDCFFDRDKEWNLHFNAKKKGTTGREGAANPYILPIFIIDKDEVSKEIINTFSQIDEIFRGIKKENITGLSSNVKATFWELKESLCINEDYTSNFIIPIGIIYANRAV